MFAIEKAESAFGFVSLRLGSWRRANTALFSVKISGVLK
jgi:hypothetical protein